MFKLSKWCWGWVIIISRKSVPPFSIVICHLWVPGICPANSPTHLVQGDPRRPTAAPSAWDDMRVAWRGLMDGVHFSFRFKTNELNIIPCRKDRNTQQPHSDFYHNQNRSPKDLHRSDSDRWASRDMLVKNSCLLWKGKVCKIIEKMALVFEKPLLE